ncbi:MAG: BREX system Lon protease-like protein BrxL [Bacteroides cellulosilyticus]
MVFVKGWDIPRMNEGLKICGWALNSEYFYVYYAYAPGDDVSYRAIVDRLVDYPADSDTRNTEAVKRIATAYLKLLFPHVRSIEDVKPREFNQYCLRPAFRMREIVLRQMVCLMLNIREKKCQNFL